MNIDQYRALLNEEKSRLEESLRTVARKNPTNAQDWEPILSGPLEPEADPLDIAERTTDFDTHASITADLETRYNQVVDALARIDAGTYGVCTVDGEQIEVGRLDADPAARTCLKHVNH